MTAHLLSEPAITDSQTIEQSIARDLALLPDVRHILVERADGIVNVVVALDHPSKQVRESVFEKEFALMDEFSETSFDFNLIPAHGRTPEDLASHARLIYSRKAA